MPTIQIRTDNYKKCLKREYLVEIIKKAIKKKDPTISTISPEETSGYEQELYTLSIIGSTLRKIKEAEYSQNKFRYEQEKSKFYKNIFLLH